MFFEDHIDDAKYCGHLYGLGSGSAYVQNGTGNAYEEEANKQQSWHHSETLPSCGSHAQSSAALKPSFINRMTITEEHETYTHTSFSKLLLIGSAHLRQLNMMVKKKKSQLSSHMPPLAACVCEFSLVFLRSSVHVLVGSVEFNMLEKDGILVFLKCSVEMFCTLKL